MALLILGFGLHCLELSLGSDLKKTIIKITAVSFFCYALFGWALAGNQVEMAFTPARVTRVEGTLTEDSLLCKSGKQLLRISLRSCATQDGAEGSAKGTISALVKVDEVLVSGTRLTLYGELAPEGSLFLADTLQVLALSRWRAFRRTILLLVERRFFQVIEDDASRSLALMLLLGRTSDSAFPLKEVSVQSGCAHLLALSGMHLQFFIALFSILLVPLAGKRRARGFSVGIALVYVLLVGPKPSLIRAMGMALISLFLKGRMAPYYSFLATACIQVALFPSAVSSMGCLFSYAAYGGLLCNRLFSFYRPKALEPFFASLYAILFTAIPTLAVWGTWQIGGLLIAFLASPLMFFLMGSSLLVLLFGKGFSPLVGALQRLLHALFSWGSSLFGGGVTLRGFLFYLFAVLTLLASIGYAERALLIKRRDSYELEIRIRFTESHQGLA